MSASQEEPGKILDSPEEVLSTLHKSGKRRWLYPTPSKGRFYWMRLIVGWALIAIFVALPLVEIGGKPAIFLDLANREFTFFGLTLYPTDTLLLMLFLLSIFVTVFFVTALLGRVWCGWACPQTVYLEFVFRPIERLIEGKELKRKRRDEGPWNFDKAWRKGLKFVVYLGLSALLAHTFVAYFVSWDRLLVWMTGPPTEHWFYFAMMAVTTGLVLFDFGYFREQMCTITCPYARLQSVLQDRDSMIVSYDPGRGEPRGRRTREQRNKEKSGVDIPLGDCIDCGACVRTCPTGIDIREGLQMECVACTQCVDACDEIMESIDKPLGLIRYTSENEIEGEETNIVRPRTVLYTVLLIGLVTAFFIVLGNRESVNVNVVRAVGAPFKMLPDEQVANRLKFRIQNRTGTDGTFHVEALEPKEADVKIVGRPDIKVSHGETVRTEAWIVAPRSAFDNARRQGKFRIYDDAGNEEIVTFMLLGPDP